MRCSIICWRWEGTDAMDGYESAETLRNLVAVLTTIRIDIAEARALANELQPHLRLHARNIALALRDELGLI